MNARHGSAVLSCWSVLHHAGQRRLIVAENRDGILGNHQFILQNEAEEKMIVFSNKNVSSTEEFLILLRNGSLLLQHVDTLLASSENIRCLLHDDLLEGAVVVKSARKRYS